MCHQFDDTLFVMLKYLQGKNDVYHSDKNVRKPKPKLKPYNVYDIQAIYMPPTIKQTLDRELFIRRETLDSVIYEHSAITLKMNTLEKRRR